jgi:hypothetical protein
MKAVPRRPRRWARSKRSTARPHAWLGVPKCATRTHDAYAESNGFLMLVSDGERLTGAYALRPEAAE